jgi:phenylpropionate dioxygenase-like ring-hydroxylating dioxygenase large terminal subunit
MADLPPTLPAFDPDLPLEKASTLPSDWYLDSRVDILEREKVFGSSWQAVGRSSQAREPGQFVTADIAGEPIVVIRGDDGCLRAFYNVCRHRAARVVSESEGRAGKLRCRYHGWTYDLAGKLRGVPEFDGVADFRREDNSLPQIAVAPWGPIIWANLDPDAGSLLEFLGPLPEKCAGLGLEKLHFVERRQYELACNWKVYVDNYLDGGYHVNTVHPGLAGVIDYSRYRTEVSGMTSVQISPLAPSNDNVGQVRTGDCAYYWWIYPNFMINIYEGVMDTNLVLPLGPGNCRVIFDFYFSDPDLPGRREFIRQSIAVAHQIQQEDAGICEEVQRGLASRSYKTGRFSVRREAGGHHFHRLLARALQHSR